MNSPLFSYLPPEFENLDGFRYAFEALENTAGTGAFDEAKNDIEQLAADLFPASDGLSSEGLRRWCEALHINGAGLTDENKLFRIRSVLAEKRPYNLGALRTMLKDICGENFILTVSGFSVNVMLGLANADQVNAVTELLERVVPANMAITTGIMYHTHSEYASSNHTELHAYTHTQLREKES